MQRLPIISIILSVAACVAMILFYSTGRSKTVYIKTGDVFKEFEMSKELKSKFENISNSRKHLIDSLELSLKLMAGELQAETKPDMEKRKLFEYKKAEYLKKKHEIDEDNQRMSDTYDQQIWSRLSQYAKNYGEIKGYDFVYGATGDGTIMFANEHLDITKDFIPFINQQYKGIQ